MNNTTTHKMTKAWLQTQTNAIARVRLTVSKFTTLSLLTLLSIVIIPLLREAVG